MKPPNVEIFVEILKDKDKEIFMNDRYQSPLSERYASKDAVHLSPDKV